jgi:hypothetical protein
VRILLVKVVVPLTSFLQLSCFGSFEDDLSPAFLVKVLSHAEYERTLRDTMKKSHISNSFLMCTLLLFGPTLLRWWVLREEEGVLGC